MGPNDTRECKHSKLKISNATECTDKEKDVEGHNCAETDRTVMHGADNSDRHSGFSPLCPTLYYLLLVTNVDYYVVITGMVCVNKVAEVEESI
jgi:hypothetical protein